MRYLYIAGKWTDAADGGTSQTINPYLPQAEWGGFGKSGIGRELGPSGLDEYQEK